MIKYPKIKRIDAEEMQIMFPCKDAFVSEKLDGCNIQIYKKDGQVCIGKRNTMLFFGSKECKDGQFSEFAKFVKESNWDFLEDGVFLYGEGLKGRKVGDDYKTIGKISYKRKEPFVLFDIYDSNKDRWIRPFSSKWDKIIASFKEANRKDMSVVPFIDKEVTIEDAEAAERYLGSSTWSDEVNKEGVVVKKYLPDGEVIMAKLVSKEFREVIKHKKNPKGSDYKAIIQSVVTKARVEKIMRKQNITDMTGAGVMIKSVIEDVFEEEEKYLKELAWKMFKKEVGKIMPYVIKGEFEEIINESSVC